MIGRIFWVIAQIYEMVQAITDKRNKGNKQGQALTSSAWVHYERSREINVLEMRVIC